MLSNANVITLDGDRPHAEAVLIRGDRIAAVGSDGEVVAAARPDARVVDLAGLTVVPGFYDAHQHRIANGPGALGLAAEEIIDAAIASGLTTINELYVDEERLANLVALDDAGSLRLDVNAYLPVNENSESGTPFAPYWDAYEQGEMVSQNVRVAGLKFFTDYDNASFLLWEQRDLNEFVLARHREGWQLALKTVSVASLDMILTALQRASRAESSVVDGRARLEHNLFATTAQIDVIVELGVVPVINLNNPGQLVGDASVDGLVASQPAGSYAPWRNMVGVGLPVAACSGFPSYYVDEPTGAPFGSPIHMIYQAVTRVGNLGQRPPDELLDQAITAEEALRSLTIDAARASFEEGTKGSIEAGKLADLVVLSADPLAVEAEAINAIEVLATLIGGRSEHCALGAGCDLLAGRLSEPIPTTEPPASPAPGLVNLAAEAVVSASSELSGFPAGNVSDQQPDHWNSAGLSPQAIELSLAEPSAVDEIRLHVAQDPAGPSVHELWIASGGGSAELVRVFEGQTFDGDVLVFVADETMNDVTLVRVVTTSLGDLFPAWREIEVLGPGNAPS